MTAARFANSASWSGTQWNVAVDSDRVDRPVDRQRPAQVGDDVLDPVAEAGEPLARGLDHRRRAVERDDVPPSGSRSASSCSVTRPVPQPASRTRSSPCERQPVEDGRAPAGHRVGDAVVRPGVPVARQSGRRAAGRLGSPAGREPGLASPRRRATRRTTPPPPIASRPAATNIAWWKASIDAAAAAAIWSGVAPAGGGLSGGNCWRTARIVVSSPGAIGAERRVERAR